MAILEQVLNKIKPLHKKQREFLVLLIGGLIGIAGKRTFRNLARYINLEEHTFLRQMKKTLNFVSINLELIKASVVGSGEVLIAAQDASFISKAGKKTNGLGYFWNGCAGKPEKGLELDVIAIVRVEEKKEALTLSAKQVPPNPTPKTGKKRQKTTELSRIDFYLDHLKSIQDQLAKLGIKHIAFDAFLSKHKYVGGLAAIGLYGVSKLRKDARLRKLYKGEQKPRGRKKIFDNAKVNFDDPEECAMITIGDVELRSCLAYSVSLEQIINVVLVRKYIDEKRYGEVLLFSTDLELPAEQIYRFYTSRFQIEFIFRDAKGFTGLGDCQSRDAQRLDYHFNASLTALNVIRIEDALEQKKQNVTRPFSMANWSRKYHVEIVVNRIISMFELDPTCIKLHPKYQSLLAFGNIKH
jgi:hypothetical protein